MCSFYILYFMAYQTVVDKAISVAENNASSEDTMRIALATLTTPTRWRGFLRHFWGSALEPEVHVAESGCIRHKGLLTR